MVINDIAAVLTKRATTQEEFEERVMESTIKGWYALDPSKTHTIDMALTFKKGLKLNKSSFNRTEKEFYKRALKTSYAHRDKVAQTVSKKLGIKIAPTAIKNQQMDVTVQADISKEASEIWNSISDNKKAIEADKKFASFAIGLRPYVYFIFELMSIGQTIEEADRQWMVVQKIIETEIKPNLHILE